MRRRIALAAAVMLFGVVMAGCGSDDDDETAAGDDAPAGTTVEIEAADISFTPTEIELSAGEPVTFVVDNTGQLKHNLTVEDLGIDEDVDGGQSISVPATPEAGTYTFICEYHPGQMTGTITVT